MIVFVFVFLLMSSSAHAQLVRGKMTCAQVIAWVESATPEMLERAKMLLSERDLLYAQRCLRQHRQAKE